MRTKYNERKKKLKELHFSDKLAFMATGILLVAPYLLAYKIGFILNHLSHKFTINMTHNFIGTYHG